MVSDCGRVTLGESLGLWRVECSQGRRLGSQVCGSPWFFGGPTGSDAPCRGFQVKHPGRRPAADPTSLEALRLLGVVHLCSFHFGEHHLDDNRAPLRDDNRAHQWLSERGQEKSL